MRVLRESRGFLVLAVTGFWLAQFYSPIPEHVRESMEAIQGEAALGSFVRGIHFWVANIVVVTVVLHMLGEIPDPEIEVTKPPFYFYWLYAFENWFGVEAILYAGLAFFGLLALVPFVDRSPLRSLRCRPVAAIAGAVVVIALVVLSLVVFFTPVVEHVE